jgi:hypothetical protein
MSTPKYPRYPLTSTRTAAISRIPTVTSHAIFERGTPGILQIPVAEPALTPSLALDYLDELSIDIRAATILDSHDELVAHTGHPTESRERAERMRKLVLELLERAGGPEVEVSTPNGAVFAVRENGWTIAVVTGRYALSSLMFYDLRRVTEDLG